MSDIRLDVSVEDGDPECGLEYKFEDMSAAKVIRRDAAGGVEPAWSR